MKNIIGEFIKMSIISCVMLSCVGHNTKPLNNNNINLSVVEHSTENSAVSDSVNMFSFSLYNTLNYRKGNIIFSPFSISSALALIYAGAGNETESQIQKVLRFKDNNELFHYEFKQFVLENTYKLISSNRLWVGKSFVLENDFQNTAYKYYNAKAQELDFINKTEKSRLKINNWVEENTNGKIKNILSKGSIDEYTKLVLTNAVIFKEQWQIKFNKSESKKRLFNITYDNAVNALFMNHKKIKLDYFENDIFRSVSLPYENKNNSMIILLPNADKSIFDLEKYFSYDKFNTLLKSYTKLNVKLSIPKFKFEYSINLKKQLSGLGMGLCFTDKADFTKISNTSKLYINDVIHKAFIEVDESGTKASAATAVVMMTKKAVINPSVKSFIADKPFMYFIVNNTNNNILFMGRFSNPTR